MGSQESKTGYFIFSLRLLLDLTITTVWRESEGFPFCINLLGAVFSAVQRGMGSVNCRGMPKGFRWISASVFTKWDDLSLV